MTPPFEHIGAVVFDWAGTTVDYGSCAPAMVFQEIFRRKNIQITPGQARGPMGMAKRDHIAAILALPEVSSAWEVEHGASYSEADIDGLYEEFLPLQLETLASHSDAIPGVPEVVAQCRQRGLKIGSSTGYTHELVEAFAPAVAQQGYQPDCVLCAEDARQGRPAPWLLFRAAEILNVFPMNRIVKVDDTAPGIEAAVNAGCWSIGVTKTGNSVGLSEAEFNALSESDQAARIQQAGDHLTAAGAQRLVESAADIMPILEDIEQRLSVGKLPAARCR